VKFSEVIVDHKTGAIKKAEKITDADDLKNAKEQSQVMAEAKMSLDKAVEIAMKANSGYRAVSAIPRLDAGKPVADITLMKGEEVKKVAEKLD
jgi:2,3-bisphosphoglycerate-independent phosphoglycerate mutase